MLLNNEFEIDAGLEQTWVLLTDLERIMPCLPGAVLEGRDGDSFLGAVKIKVGPIGAHFRGAAHFAEKDDAAHTAVIAAAGKDPRGQAAANARIHARLEPVTDARTRVLIDTDLDISGRMAQFGRGAIADVSHRLLGQFAQNLSTQLLDPASTPPPAPAPSAAGTPAPSSAPPTAVTAPPPSPPAGPSGGVGGDAASMDVMALVVPMIKERYGQAIAGGLIGFALSWLAFGRRVPR